MIALGYCRRSEKTSDTERRRGRGSVVSLEVQVGAIRAACATMGWILVEPVLVDDGRTGGPTKKSQRLAELRAAVKASGARVIVCYHIDRLARDLVGLIGTVREWKARGIRVWVVGRGWYDVSTSSGYLAGVVEGMVAEHHRMITSEKVTAALAQRKAEGRRYSRHIPYGYALAGQKKLVPVAKEQAALAFIRRWQQQQAGLAKRASLTQLGQALEAAGHHTRTGAPWANSLLFYILRRLDPPGAAPGEPVAAAV